MSEWAKFYMGRVGDGYTNYAEKRYAPMIEELNCDARSVLEEGCGIGTVSKILLNYQPFLDVTLADLDLTMLRLAIKNLGDRLPIDKIKMMDIRGKDKPCVDLIHSHGVLEHFQDQDIKVILRHQRDKCAKLIHYVPTDGYDKPSFGDERLLPIQYWLDKFNPTRYKTFNNDKDLLLIWER